MFWRFSGIWRLRVCTWFAPRERGQYRERGGAAQYEVQVGPGSIRLHAEYRAIECLAGDLLS